MLSVVTAIAFDSVGAVASLIALSVNAVFVSSVEDSRVDAFYPVGAMMVTGDAMAASAGECSIILSS